VLAETTEPTGIQALPQELICKEELILLLKKTVEMHTLCIALESSKAKIQEIWKIKLLNLMKW